MESLARKFANVPEATVEMEQYPQTFCQTYNLRGENRRTFLKASLDFVVEMKELADKNLLRENKKLWAKIGKAQETMNRVAEHQNIPMNGNGMARFVGFLFLMLNRFPDTFFKFYRIK